MADVHSFFGGAVAQPELFEMHLLNHHRAQLHPTHPPARRILQLNTHFHTFGANTLAAPGGGGGNAASSGVVARIARAYT